MPEAPKMTALICIDISVFFRGIVIDHDILRQADHGEDLLVVGGQSRSDDTLTSLARLCDRRNENCDSGAGQYDSRSTMEANLLRSLLCYCVVRLENRGFRVRCDVAGQRDQPHAPLAA